MSNVTIDYTNHRGERAKREISSPMQIKFRATAWHPESQWILDAWDTAKQEFRSFAMKSIHSWEPAP